MMVVVLGAMYIWLAPTAEAPMLDGIMCTEDARVCDDGTTVGRTGPDCEFVCPDGGDIIEDVSDLEAVVVSDIAVDTPTTGTIISSPLTLTGEAKGFWYFEATAPVELLDWSGTVIATGFVTATGDWMTVDFVPFTGTLSFVSPYAPGDPIAWKQGSLVFKKDNPSGEPVNDDSVTIPIQFAP